MEISVNLQEQIESMVANFEDWIPEPDGIDASVYGVYNFFDDGVWFVAHNNECDMGKATKLVKLA